MTNERKICTFYLDNYFFGVDVFQIQEVIRYHEMTTVPLADQTISGLINLRGQIVTAIDMRKRLDFPCWKKIKSQPILLYVLTMVQ